MKKFILGLLLSFCINGMAFPIRHFHHYSHQSSHITTHPHNHTTTRIRSIQPHKIRSVTKRHHTKMVSTYWRNGILYYIILHPKKGHVYDNGLVLCEGCNKVLVKKGVRYCSKCRRLKKSKR